MAAGCASPALLSPGGRHLLFVHLPNAQGNFRDMGEHRTVSTDEPLAFMRHMERSVSHKRVLWVATLYLPLPSLRPSGAAEVRYCETSMKDCFGLSYLHKFFSVPFLQMQVGARGLFALPSCTAHARERTTCHYTISCLYVRANKPCPPCPLARDVAATAAGEQATAAGRTTVGGAWCVGHGALV